MNGQAARVLDVARSLVRPVAGAASGSERHRDVLWPKRRQQPDCVAQASSALLPLRGEKLEGKSFAFTTHQARPMKRGQFRPAYTGRTNLPRLFKAARPARFYPAERRR